MTLLRDDLETALWTLGALLQDRREDHDLVVIGGGALLLLGVIQRATRDLDAVGRVVDGVLVSAEPLPGALQQAIRDVADALELAPNWLNAGPAEMLFAVNLPEGLLERAQVSNYGGLTVRLAARSDLICFKLDAAADKWPDQSRHLGDLRNLVPSPSELANARQWCRSHREPQEQRAVDDVISAMVLDSSDE